MFSLPYSSFASSSVMPQVPIGGCVNTFKGSSDWERGGEGKGKGSFNDRVGLFGVGLLSHTSRGSGRGTARSEEVVEAAVVAYSRGRGRGTAEAVQRQRQTHRQPQR